MEINYWFFGVLSIILIMWCFATPGIENFDPFNQHIGPKVHVKLANNQIDAEYFSRQMIPSDGYSRCTQVPCPDKFNTDKYVCWSCCNYN